MCRKWRTTGLYMSDEKGAIWWRSLVYAALVRAMSSGYQEIPRVAQNDKEKVGTCHSERRKAWNRGKAHGGKRCKESMK